MEAQIIESENPFSYHSMMAPSMAHPDFLAHLENYSLLSDIPKAKISVISEVKYMMKELQYFTINIALPFNGLGVDITEKYNGNYLFKRRLFSCSVAKKLNAQLSVGLRWSYGKIMIVNQPALNYLSGSLALNMIPSQGLRIGVGADHVINVLYHPKSTEKLQIVYKVGIGIDCTDEFYMGVNMKKAQGDQLNCVASLHYQIGKKAKIKYGINTTSFSNEIGIDIALRRMKMMLDLHFHPQLGPSSFFALQNNNE